MWLLIVFVLIRNGDVQIFTQPFETELLCLQAESAIIRLNQATEAVCIKTKE